MRRGLKPELLDLRQVFAFNGRAPAPMRRGLKRWNRRGKRGIEPGARARPDEKGIETHRVTCTAVRRIGRAPAPMRRGLKHRNPVCCQSRSPWARARPDEKGIETFKTITWRISQ